MSDNKSNKILVVDDVEDNITLLEFDLGDDGFEIDTAHNGRECLDKVESDPPDLILLDMMMPVMGGLEALRALKANPSTEDIPVLMLSASDQESSIISALDLGAHDYLSKPIIYEVLSARIRSALRLRDSQKELEVANAKLKEMAYTDPLTQAYNRRHFYELCHNELNRAYRTEKPLVVIMMDIDHFKKINDNYGHPAGDYVLQSVAKLCMGALRDYDIFGRFGGEEFIVCCPDCDQPTATAIAERLRSDIDSYQFQWQDKDISATASFGLAMTEAGNPKSIDQLINDADKRLYQAKATGRNRVVA